MHKPRMGATGVRGSGSGTGPRSRDVEIRTLLKDFVAELLGDFDAGQSRICNHTPHEIKPELQIRYEQRLKKQL